MYLYILQSKIVLPTMVCVLDSTVLRKCINKIVCNLQREKIIFSTSTHGETMEKLVKCVVATHETVSGMNAIPVTSEMLVFCIYHTLVLDKHEQALPKKYTYIFSSHTLNVFLLSDSIYVEFNVQGLGEAAPHGARLPHF